MIHFLKIFNVISPFLNFQSFSSDFLKKPKISLVFLIRPFLIRPDWVYFSKTFTLWSYVYEHFNLKSVSVYINERKITKTLKFFSLKNYVMNNKAAQKAVTYLCDSHNWHTKLANHKIAPILSFVASPIFLEMQDHLKIARKSFLCPAKKNGAKVNEASKCFPVWQQSSFKDTSLTRVMPNDDRWEQYEYTVVFL